MRLWWQSGLKKYEPTEAQWPIHLTPHRFIQIAGGERGGKSMTSAMFIVPQSADLELVWLIADDYNSTKPEWEYLRNEYRELGLIEAISDPNTQYSPRMMRLKTGLEIRTISAADEVKIASMAPDGIVLCEAAQMSHNVWLRARGRVAQKRGWVLLEGTFEDGEPWYDDLYNAWQPGDSLGHIAFSLPSWSNTFEFPGGYDDPEMVALRAEMSPERFMARHGGVPVPPADVVFPEFNFDKHVGDYPFDPRYPVELAIDPGWAGAYAVCALQYVPVFPGGIAVRVVDEIYVQRTQAHHVIDQVFERPWVENIIPDHAGVIDIAGRAHTGQESHFEIWASRGFRLESVPVGIEDGIERYRTFLVDPATSKPRLFYNGPTTQMSQREHRLYRYPKAREGRTVREKPIDRDNHAIKAITYALVRKFGFTRARKSGRKKARYNYGIQADSNGPFGAYPGRPRPLQERSYADRYVAAHERWKKAAFPNGDPRVRSTRRFRVRKA